MEQYINECVSLKETGLSTKTDKFSQLYKKECAEMCDTVCSAEILYGKQNGPHYKQLATKKLIRKLTRSTRIQCKINNKDSN